MKTKILFKHKWLIYFIEWKYPSNSFLELMNEALSQQFEEITKHPINIKWMHVENFINDEENMVTRMICRPDIYKSYVKDESVIIYYDVNKKRIIDPKEDIKRGEVVFMWEKLVMEEYEFVKPTNEKKRIFNYSEPFPIKIDFTNISSDILIELKLISFKDKKAIISVFEKFQDSFNGPDYPNGIMHSLYLIEFKNNTCIFKMDLGSSDFTIVFEKLNSELNKLIENSIIDLKELSYKSI